MGENVSWAYTNSVNVTATELSYFFWWEKTDQKAMGSKYNRYQHIYIDNFNTIQLAGIEWIKAGDEAHNNNIFTGENVSWAEHLKTT